MRYGISLVCLCFVWLRPSFPHLHANSVSFHVSVIFFSSMFPRFYDFMYQVHSCFAVVCTSGVKYHS